MITEHAALIYTMVLVSAADRDMTDSELRVIGTDVTSLQASAGRAVRFPTWSELYQGSLVAGSVVNNDPDLKAAYLGA